MQGADSGMTYEQQVGAQLLNNYLPPLPQLEELDVSAKKAGGSVAAVAQECLTALSNEICSCTPSCTRLLAAKQSKVLRICMYGVTRSSLLVLAFMKGQLNACARAELSTPIQSFSPDLKLWPHLISTLAVVSFVDAPIPTLCPGCDCYVAGHLGVPPAWP